MRCTGNNIRVTINKLTVSYNDHGPEDAPVIIFIHGFPFNKSMWDKQVEALKDNYRVIAYDIRGHGNSDAGIGDFFIELFVIDLLHLINQLKLEKPILCGLSMGGYIALNAVIRFPALFDALILNDSQCIADTPEQKEKRKLTMVNIKENGVEKFADDSIKNLFASESYIKKKKEIAAIKEMIMNTSKLSLCNTLNALAERKESCSQLHEIDIPVLIMVGKEDKITPLAAARMMHENIHDSSLKIIAHAGHVANMENPAAFNLHLATFVDQVAKKTFCLSDTDGN
jgi:pimeloyl-ACP methyl ester carboxylesterase